MAVYLRVIFSRPFFFLISFSCFLPALLRAVLGDILERGWWMGMGWNEWRRFLIMCITFFQFSERGEWGRRNIFIPLAFTFHPAALHYNI